MAVEDLFARSGGDLPTAIDGEIMPRDFRKAR
jgi:hypothetical protein